MRRPSGLRSIASDLLDHLGGRLEERGVAGQRLGQGPHRLRRLLEPVPRQGEQERLVHVGRGGGAQAGSSHLRGERLGVGRGLGCVRLRGIVGRAPGLHGRHASGGQCQHEEDDGAGEHHAQPPDQPGLGVLPLLGAALLQVGQLPGRGQEVVLGAGQARRAPDLPVMDAGQPHPAVELAVRTPHGVPGVGSGREVVQHPLALDVVVQPAAQAGPRPGERLVGDLEDPVVTRDEPGGHEHLDQPLPLGVGRHDPAGHPDPDGLPPRPRRDEPEHQVPQGVPVPDLDMGVQPLGGLGDGTVDASRGAVAVHGEGVALPSSPRLEEHVGEQRQRSGVVLDLVRPGGRRARARRSARPAGPAPRWPGRAPPRRGRRPGAGPARAAGRSRGGTRGRPGGRHGARPPRTAAGDSAISSRRNSRCSEGSLHSEKSSSNWSTSSAVPSGSPASAVRASRGRVPGTTMSTGVPRARSRVATPARSSDDLPDPDGPTRASNGVRRSTSRQASTSASRPK